MAVIRIGIGNIFSRGELNPPVPRCVYCLAFFDTVVCNIAVLLLILFDDRFFVLPGPAVNDNDFELTFLIQGLVYEILKTPAHEPLRVIRGDDSRDFEL